MITVSRSGLKERRKGLKRTKEELELVSPENEMRCQNAQKQVLSGLKLDEIGAQLLKHVGDQSPPSEPLP